MGPQFIRNSGLFEGLHENYGVQVKDHGDVLEVEKSAKNYNTHIKNLHVLDPSLEALNNRVG